MTERNKKCPTRPGRLCCHIQLDSDGRFTKSVSEFRLSRCWRSELIASPVCWLYCNKLDSYTWQVSTWWNYWNAFQPAPAWFNAGFSTVVNEGIWSDFHLVTGTADIGTFKELSIDTPVATSTFCDLNLNWQFSPCSPHQLISIMPSKWACLL